jgi:arylformamidase
MIIDLSVTLNQQTPVYPGDPATKIEPANTIDKSGCNDHYISTNNHTGTHIDAPLHMIAGGKTLDQISLEQFVSRGHLVEVAGGFTQEVLEQADIRAGDIVLFHTGMSKYYYEPAYFETYPVMSEDVARYLVAQKVKMVGVDAGSVDDADGFPIHKILLGGNVLIIENLTNLDALADKEFSVYALPIKLNVDGAPARVIAEVKS